MAWLNDFMKQFYDYDYSNSWEWDTDNLVNYDDYLNPWTSSTYSRDSRSYAPTVHGQLGDNREHYNYTLGIENKPEYKAFTDALLDKDGNFTEMGKVWAHDVDRLIGGNPNGFSSLATFYDEKGNIRPKWEVTTKNAHGHTRQTFDDLREYVNYIRNDQVLGPRHNGFLRKGTRYYWKDNKGGKHYINPELAKRYKELSRQNGLKEQNDPLTTWTDIEIGFDPNNPTSTGIPGNAPADRGSAPAGGTGRGSIRVGAGGNPNGAGDSNDQKGPFSKLAKHLPGLLEGLRLAGGLYFNNKIYNDKLKGINPNLKQSYHTYRNIVGDEGTKQAYYRRAAQGQTKAAKPVTSDQDRQVAYQMESKRAADDLRAQGDLADNAEIKRTSDESNQHAWANTQRDTEVANWNREQLVNTAAAKADLLAQKHAADWSSWNNYSLAQENRLRKRANQQRAFDQQIKISELQAEMEDDPEVAKAYERLLQVEKENTDSEGNMDMNKIQSSEAYKAYKKASREAKKRYYEGLRDYLLLAKKGSKLKVSTKTNDDLLYKAARDTVIHFRKMSKMSNDSTLKSRERGFKLTPHPKTPKYNTGGVAPFTVFTPLADGGSQEISSEYQAGSDALGLKASSGSSSQDKKGKELLDLTKELFGKLDGLPVDVKMVANKMQNFLYRTKLYGKELDTTDIAQQYMQYVAQIASIKHSKDVFDKAKEDAISNGTMEDFAVTNEGKYIVQYVGEGDQKGKITEATLEQIKKSEGKLNPLTNGNLLSLRAYSPQLLLNKGDYYMNNAVANSTGMDQITKKIKELMEGVKSSEKTIEGYTKVQSDKIKSGVEILEKKGQEPLDKAPDGDYQTKYTYKSNKESVQATLSYILKTLPTNMKAVLKMHAYKNGITVESILKDLVTSKLEIQDDYTLQAATGKAASGKGSAGKDLEDEVKNNPLLAMQREIGGTYKTYGLITRDGHAEMSVNGTHYSMLNGIKDDTSAKKMLMDSGIQGILDSSYGITFGDQVISPDRLKDIMYDSSDGGIVVTLPCKIVDGVRQVNLDILEKFEKAEKEAFEKTHDRKSPQYQKELGRLLKAEHLDSLLDDNGLPNKKMFGQFLVVEAYASDKIPFKDKSSQFMEKINNPTKELEDRLNNALSTAPSGKASNYGLDVKDHWSLFEMTYDDIYRGNLFIPINQNPNSAMLAAGEKTTSDQAAELEEVYQRELKRQSYNNKSNSLQ